MKYEVLLFDADGTLLDFKKSEAIGLTKVFETFHIPDSNRYRQYYLNLNDALWRGFEEGKYPKQYIFDVRFQMMLDHFHLEGDGRAMERCYRKWLNKGCHLMKDALPVIKQLAETHVLYIITNGTSHTQHQRLKDSGLYPYFQQVFVSEEIGCQKPQKEYFDYVVNQIQKPRDRMLVIGDSLHSDILGAKQANIASCLLNPDHLKPDGDILPDYEISALTDIWNILS